ncbi:MAG: hypothetical protein AAGC77_14785 [Pseudomonadota bacterium]
MGLKRSKTTTIACAAAITMVASGDIALAHDAGGADHRHEDQLVHENGIGPDPDRDSNPATDSSAFSIVGDPAILKDDPPFEVITFEPPPGRNGDPIRTDYELDFGVTFGRGLSWQVCRGPIRSQIDSMCTYEAAPSGAYAAGYLDHLNLPLEITFDAPVCFVSMAIYPSGGEKNEPFELKIESWSEDGAKMRAKTVDFVWTEQTVRWRHMAGAYFLETPAKKVAISMKTKKGALARDALRFLMDDLAFMETGCESALAEHAAD